MSEAALIIVSNRGPAQFERDEDGNRTVRRGGGGLVTALSGLVSHRDALWIASAMTDEDILVSEEEGGPVSLDIDGIDYRVMMVESDPRAYDRFYNVIANPILWFIQHYLWDLSNAPDIRQEELDAWDEGYQQVNSDIAAAVVKQIADQDEPLVMLHDYHLYTAPGMIRAARADVFLHFFVHIPWSQPDSWRVLPKRIREAIYEGMLANDIIGFHTHQYCINFLRCCDELLEGTDIDYLNAEVTYKGHTTLARAYPLGIDAERLRRAAESKEVAEAEREVLERRRRYLIIRVDRADLSKNVLRGFTAFDTFLTQHPEFREQVTFIAHLQPSRQDVPEYAEYRERIEALVAVVNHRHGTTDWMPIDLRIYENFPDAVARYKHYDLLMVNAIFDGMNLVAKEAPAVNTRDGVLMLSENTGSHHELWDWVISVNPFDIQEQSDAIYRALTMDPEQKAEWAQGLRDIIFSRNPGDWVDDQLADIEKARAARTSSSAPGERSAAPAPWRAVAGVRIRWRGVARVAAIVVVGLIALRLVPSLLRAPEPPPLGRDVGLPKAKPARKHVRRQSLPDAPASTAVIGTRTHRHRRHHHHKHKHPAPPSRTSSEPFQTNSGTGGISPSPNPGIRPAARAGTAAGARSGTLTGTPIRAWRR